MPLVVLLIACRGAPLGTPVADDYSFLHRYAFQRPLDPFGSMGGAYYWRPVSRQLYFALVQPWVFAAPAGVAVLHGALLALLGLLLYRIARRFVPTPVAAAVTAAALLSEPTRVLLGWPSGAQHLLAGTAIALAVHEALAGRLAVAALAALVGVMSHESGVWALPILPLAAWRSQRGRAPMGRGLAAAASVGALWAAGYVVALRHGVLLPLGSTPAGGAGPLERLPELYSRALLAALSLEDLHGARDLLVAAWVANALVAALIVAFRPEARGRLRDALPLVAASALVWGVGLLPLASLLPDWNAWRAFVPTLGFSVAAAGVLGAVSPRNAQAVVGLRLIALLASPLAPAIVTKAPPQNGSHVSFQQLVRLQHIVSASRRAMLEGVPTLPRGARICYWELPQLAEFAFQGSRALEVWYGDSTLTWVGFGGAVGLRTRFAAGIEFRYGDPVFAATVPGPAIESFQRAATLVEADRIPEADAALREAMQRSGQARGPFCASVLQNLAMNAARRNAFAEAQALVDSAAAVGPETADLWVVRCVLADARGDRRAAIEAVQRALSLNPAHPVAREFARTLGLTP